MNSQDYSYEELVDQLDEKEKELNKLRAQSQSLEQKVEQLENHIKGSLDFDSEQDKKFRSTGEGNPSDQFLLETLMEFISDSIYFKNLNSEFIKVSRSFAQKHGIKNTEEAIGKSDFDFFTPEHAQKAFSDEQRIIITGEPLDNVEEKETWTDGHETWASTTKMPLRDNFGKIIGTFGISRDITKRKKAEKALKENQKKLYELNATKDKLFTIISHDLKNLFNSILGFSEMLVDKINNMEYDKSKSYANIIHNSATQSYELLQNLLQWARMQTGKLHFNPEEILVSDIVNKVLKLLEPNVKEKNIKIQSFINPELKVIADQNMVETILRNFISNAVKYTHEEGKIDIFCEQNQKEIKISVRDSGIGMSKEDQEKLFKIDESFRISGTNDEKGTGLGLIVCKELIEKHDGKLFLHSEKNKGSTFSFTIPQKKSFVN